MHEGEEGRRDAELLQAQKLVIHLYCLSGKDFQVDRGLICRVVLPIQTSVPAQSKLCALHEERRALKKSMSSLRSPSPPPLSRIVLLFLLIFKARSACQLVFDQVLLTGSQAAE